jgi:hypothetical protein
MPTSRTRPTRPGVGPCGGAASHRARICALIRHEALQLEKQFIPRVDPAFPINLFHLGFDRFRCHSHKLRHFIPSEPFYNEGNKRALPRREPIMRGKRDNVLERVVALDERNSRVGTA